MRIPSSAPRAVLVSFLIVGAVGLAGCSKSDDAKTAAGATPTSGGTVPSADAAQPPPDAPPPPPTADASAWTPSALDELMAPVALYPDAILAQVLTASTNSQEVLDAGNWLLDNQSLKPEELTKAAADAGFSPSVQALVHFPTLVDMMCRELDWTRQVGDAFTADQAAVLASVQRLRAQAAAAGNLKSSPEMKVETTGDPDKQTIIIQPANPQVIYVPQYNPTQVYSAPPPTTTTATTSSGITTEQAVLGGLLAFGAGILVANAFDDDHHDDYPYPNWGYGGVYCGPRPYYPHNTFVYAPRYPGYRPAAGYRPPATYPNRYNNSNIYRNTNVNVTNNNYFNRFDKNQNRLPSYQPRSPIASPATRPTSRQTTYAGANQPRATTQAATRDRVAAAPSGTYQGNRPQRQPAGAGARGGQPAPTGSYQGARPQTGQANAQRLTAGADRGYPKTTGNRADVTPSTQKRGGSISGAGTNQASMDRAASERGRASMKAAPRPSATQQRGGGNKGTSQQRAKSQNRARQQ